MVDVPSQVVKITQTLPHAFVPWRDGLALPAEFGATIADTAVLPYVIEIQVSVTADLGPVLDEVRFSRRPGGAPITPRVLRAAKLATYVEQAAALAAYTVEEKDGSIIYEPRMNPERVTRQSGRRRTRMTDEELRKVADVYRAALQASEGRKRPREAVLKKWSVSDATAARYIAAAKEKGYLER